VTPTELTQFLHEHVRLSRAMQVRAVEASSVEVVLAAPLEPNLNHHGTVFGGSSATLALLAAWSLLHIRLRATGIDCTLVINRTTTDYTAPLSGEFTATASSPASDDWSHFLHVFRNKGKARISVLSVLRQAGRDGSAEAGRLEGVFVALGLVRV
jgi:thioesterase domain-containing protein